MNEIKSSHDLISKTPEEIVGLARSACGRVRAEDDKASQALFKKTKYDIWLMGACFLHYTNSPPARKTGTTFIDMGDQEKQKKWVEENLTGYSYATACQWRKLAKRIPLDKFMQFDSVADANKSIEQKQDNPRLKKKQPAPNTTVPATGQARIVSEESENTPPASPTDKSKKVVETKQSSQSKMIYDFRQFMLLLKRHQVTPDELVLLDSIKELINKLIG